MKMKKLLAMLLALVTVFGMASCGSKESTDNGANIRTASSAQKSPIPAYT